MKTLRITLIAFVSLFVMASCSKKADDVTPATTPAAELAGTYNVYQYRIDNGPQQNLPSGRTVVIKFVYVSDNQAHLLIDDRPAGHPSSDDDYGNVDLVRVGNSIDIRSGAAKLGSYENGTVEIEFEQSNGMVRFTAKR